MFRISPRSQRKGKQRKWRFEQRCHLAVRIFLYIADTHQHVFNFRHPTIEFVCNLHAFYMKPFATGFKSRFTLTEAKGPCLVPYWRAPTWIGSDKQQYPYSRLLMITWRLQSRARFISFEPEEGVSFEPEEGELLAVGCDARRGSIIQL